MPIESAADRAVFLNADEFGAVASYARVGGGSQDIAGIFDDPSMTSALGEFAGTVDALPTFFCAAVDLPDGADSEAGDSLAVGNGLYTVATIEPDGTGMVLLRLGAYVAAPVAPAGAGSLDFSIPGNPLVVLLEDI